MHPGTKLGMNFALDNDGEPVYQFFHDKNEDQGYRNPSTWGGSTQNRKTHFSLI